MHYSNYYNNFVDHSFYYQRQRDDASASCQEQISQTGVYQQEHHMPSNGHMERACDRGSMLKTHQFKPGVSLIPSFDELHGPPHPSESFNTAEKNHEFHTEAGSFNIIASKGLWDALKLEDVHEILDNLKFVFPEELEYHCLPYAYIITEIAKIISKQSCEYMNSGKKENDISIIISRKGVVEDIQVDENMAVKYNDFIREHSQFFIDKYKKKLFFERTFKAYNMNPPPFPTISRAPSCLMYHCLNRGIPHSISHDSIHARQGMDKSKMAAAHPPALPKNLPATRQMDDTNRIALNIKRQRISNNENHDPSSLKMLAAVANTLSNVDPQPNLLHSNPAPVRQEVVLPSIKEDQVSSVNTSSETAIKLPKSKRRAIKSDPEKILKTLILEKSIKLENSLKTMLARLEPISLDFEISKIPNLRYGLRATKMIPEKTVIGGLLNGKLAKKLRPGSEPSSPEYQFDILVKIGKRFFPVQFDGISPAICAPLQYKEQLLSACQSGLGKHPSILQFLNYSPAAKANVKIKYFILECEEETLKIPIIVATKNISEGEELRMDYGDAYFLLSPFYFFEIFRKIIGEKTVVLDELQQLYDIAEKHCCNKYGVIKCISPRDRQIIMKRLSAKPRALLNKWKSAFFKTLDELYNKKSEFSKL